MTHDRHHMTARKLDAIAEAINDARYNSGFDPGLTHPRKTLDEQGHRERTYVYDLARAVAAARTWKDAEWIDQERSLLEEAWGALNFILAFYEPGQRYLDTNAWKQAEASGRRVHAKLRAALDAPTPSIESEGAKLAEEFETFRIKVRDMCIYAKQQISTSGYNSTLPSATQELRDLEKRIGPTILAFLRRERRRGRRRGRSKPVNATMITPES